MPPKIYTRTGDGGKTSLIGGTKVSKGDLRIDSYGTVDELNSFIGLLADHLSGISGEADASPTPAMLTAQLRQVQDRLFVTGASLAADPEKTLKRSLPRLAPNDLLLLEQAIDRMQELLPPLQSFILPGGHPVVSTAHIARSVCRRAERLCVGMQDQALAVDPIVIGYLNRLSDYLFVVARYSAHLLRVEESAWTPGTGNDPSGQADGE